MSKPFADGAYAHRRLNLVVNGKAHEENAKVQIGPEKLTSGIIGGLGKRGLGGIVNAPRRPKGRER